MTNIPDHEKLSKERIENAVHRIAKSLNMLETTKQELEWACQSEDWDSDVVFLVDEAAMKLGFALATLTRWFDPEETFKDDKQ